LARAGETMNMMQDVIIAREDMKRIVASFVKG
jgi:hypothetical protein